MDFFAVNFVVDESKETPSGFGLLTIMEQILTTTTIHSIGILTIPTV